MGVFQDGGLKQLRGMAPTDMEFLVTIVEVAAERYAKLMSAPDEFKLGDSLPLFTTLRLLFLEEEVEKLRGQIARLRVEFLAKEKGE